MGGVVTNILKPLAEKAGQLSDKYLATYATESAERTLSKMGPQGEVLLRRLKVFESSWKSEADNIAKTTGWPLKNASSLSKSMNSDLHFGPKKEFFTNQLKAIERQYTSPETGAIKKRTAADILSAYMKEPGTQSWRKKAGVSPHSPYQPPDELEKAWGKFASWVYLSKIAVAHTMQPLNLLLEGRSTANFASGLFETMKDYQSALKQTEEAGGLVDDLLHASRPNTQLGKVLENIFHMPAFKWMRKYQIVTSAVVGKRAFLESAGNYIQSNYTSKAEEVYLKHLGIEPALIKKYGIRQEEINQAMYQMAHNAMYIRTGLETPAKWGTNSAYRLATQYKGYSFNEARIISSAYRRAYQMNGLAGIAKVSGILGTVFPIAGEFIWSIDSLINTGDPTNRNDVMKMLDDGGPIDNYISALSHVAGLGVGYSVMRAANRNGLESYLLGPLGNFIADEFTGLAHGLESGNFERLARTNLRKIPVVGSRIQRELLPTQQQEREQ